MLATLTALHFRTHPDSLDASVIEKVVKQNLYRLPDDMAGQNVLDIGGHIGTVACMAAQRGAQVWTFEPSREAYGLLLQNIEANGLQDRIVAFNLGAGRTGIRKLYHHKGNPGATGAFVKSDTFEWMWMVSLGDIFDFTMGENSFDFVKIDCEGGEREIIPEIAHGLYPLIRRMGMEIHGVLDEVNAGYLKQLDPFYTLTPLSHDEFLFDLKEEYAGDFDRAGSAPVD